MTTNRFMLVVLAAVAVLGLAGLANRFARAVVKGVEFANANEAATREINQQFTNLLPAMKNRVQLPRLGSSVNMTEIRKTMDLMLKYGLMKQPVNLAGRTLAIQ